MVVDTGFPGEPDWVLIDVPEIPLSGNLGKAPEAHDCQRLVVGQGQNRQFGPLAAIFAADSLWRPIPREGRAVATIYAFPTGYEPLGIRAGLNCLYMYSPSPNVLQARMAPASFPADCLEPLEGKVTGPVLQVRIDRDAGPPQEVPAVARWDGDFEGGRASHHIGIRCGDFWCEIGREGFRSAPARDRGIVSDRRIKPSMSLPSGEDRVRVVRNRGYYDEQLLAVKGQGGLHVGTVVATLAPHPDLGTITGEDDFTAGWVPVATAYLPQEVPGYETKQNLTQGVNEISLRKASRSTLIAEGATIDSTCMVTGDDSNWWIMVRAARSKREIVYCGSRFSHEGRIVGLPAAVRWQWLENDEKTWFPCGGGCCTQN